MKKLPVVESGCCAETKTETVGGGCCAPAPSTASSCCAPAPAEASGCCGSTSTEVGDIRTVVRERYGAVAEGRVGAAGCCAGPQVAEATLAEIGYSAEDAAAIPEGANLGLGCGNPIAFAELKGGETVLDLGSGAGIDCFLAARAVGPTGHVIGVDMTASMLERARANARKIEATTVEFRLGEIEHLPVADATVDVIISNCVVNLSPDKPQVFREAYRALRPGGRLMVSDLVLNGPLSDSVRKNVEMYVGCISGAEQRDRYLEQIRGAGFTDVEVVSESGYAVGADAFADGSAEREAFAMVTSVKVRAVKR
ncbi:MAG: arsenite methyltransferase [Candidatus Eisenbacteria bacterium]|nr:arsenite methyltransferase [Candidatus Eisenbacteria bacterium]MCC7141381.1 arsenite methyltransferase [Candidatus Eisenbacteria bacterium]